MNNSASQTGRRAYPPYPEYPYSPPIKGMFHNQTPMDASLPGQYSVYIPNNFEPCSPGVLILTPDNTSAQSFLEGEAGQGWISVSDTYGIAVIVAEPYEAGVWNMGNAMTMRDDEAFIKGVYDTIRNKATSVPVVFDLNERATYLAGYGEGGSAAHKMAMMWPQIFCGMASVDGGTVSDSIISSYGEKMAYPFAQTGSIDGYVNVSLRNREIPLPVWMISSYGASANDEAVKNHWIAAAKASEAAVNKYAQEVYENGPRRIWVTEGSVIAPETIYREFFSKVQRYPYEPGGALEWTIEHVNKNGKGFFFTETEVHGRIRRWMIYVPTSYDGSKAYPLVVAIHGGTIVTTAFTGDTRWQDAAEKYGLLIVFPQSYPGTLPLLNYAPVPFWNQYVLVPGDPPDDVAFIKEVIARMKQDYHVDAGKIFATGHSNGAGMSWRLGIEAPECFTAIAPVGLTLASFSDADVSQDRLPGNVFNTFSGSSAKNEDVPLEAPLPVWVFMGEFDGLDADHFKKGNFNDHCLKYWGKRNGFDPNTMTTGYDDTGRYYIRTWSNGRDDTPLFRYATVADCPHTYVPSICDLVWKEFFSKLTLGEDGKRYYDGQEIIRG